MDYVLASKDTKSFYLRGSVPKLTDKLVLKKDKRPLIANIETKEELAEFIGKHLFERSPYYSRAEHIITTDSKTKKEVVVEILELL